ncbi:MAG TPA: serine/threonine-protein kinase [Ktedonobacteraceae bacterium]|nr:serine/threonine-protein kinase [Ktedonobacteraceae bacterium]
MPTIYRPGQNIDHYRIIRVLGQGGASRVYLAWDHLAQQEVVLKFPNDEEIGGVVIFERYLREAKIGKLLIHPALQQHLNQEEKRSTNYLVLEYLQGHVLREVIHEYAPALLPTEQVLEIMSQVCETLVYVHKQGVIHQDIKPDNIFLLESGRIKLLDFGIALLVDEKNKKQWSGIAQLVGTPDYMAPERLEGQTGTIRSDIYAVGVVLYELLCGRTPFQETDGFAMISKHVSHDPPDILQFQLQLSPALATVVMRAIRRNPDRRYESMQELWYDLKHLEQVTPLSYVPDRPRLGGRFRPILHIAMIIFLVSLVIVVIGIIAQFVHQG